MRVEQRTTYRCDGCGAENINPQGWRSLVPICAGVTLFPMISEDFCAACIRKMRGATVGSNVIPLHTK